MSERSSSSAQHEQGFNVFVRVRPMSGKELANAVSKPTFRNIIRTKNNTEVSSPNL